MAMYDDQATYMTGVIGFLNDVAGATPRPQASTPTPTPAK
jgi:hypothetical protein